MGKRLLKRGASSSDSFAQVDDWASSNISRIRSLASVLLSTLLSVSNPTTAFQIDHRLGARPIFSRRAPLTPFMMTPEDSKDLAHQFPNLGNAIAALHTTKQAAIDQEGRLRKGSVGDLAKPCPLNLTYSPTTVYLVGCGPGEPELLTVKALRLMQTADLVLYDRLISPEILNLINPDAAMLYVGKESGKHCRPQDEINHLLYSFAVAGRTVVRLKGGDPLVFGRGGEELDYLEKKGIMVNIVPGVTAAAGIAAGLGVPLTHRDYADGVRFVTGHARSECTAPVEDRYPWVSLADPKTTLVIYMGLSTLPQLASGLLAAGMPDDMPAVAVQDGTTSTQRVVLSQLSSLSEKVKEEGLRSPTLLIIGRVVTLLQKRGRAPAESALRDLEAQAQANDAVMQADEVLEALRRANLDQRVAA